MLDDRIKIPRLAIPIKAILHRLIEGEVKSFTLSRTRTGKHFASILVDDGVAHCRLSSDPANPPAKVTGYDLGTGLTHLLISFKGQKEENPRFLKRTAKNLKRKQKALSRSKKGSRGRAKTHLLVARCHEKIANAR